MRAILIASWLLCLSDIVVGRECGYQSGKCLWWVSALSVGINIAVDVVDKRSR